MLISSDAISGLPISAAPGAFAPLPTPNQWLNFDWPNPARQRGFAHLDAAVVNLLVTTLAVTAASPFYQTDWPNPRGSTPGVSLRTHTNNALTTALVSIPKAQLDWPNPRGPVPSTTLKTHVQGALTTALIPIPAKLADWPNPRGATPAGNIGTLTSSGLALTNTVAGTPNQWLNFDWPNPRGATPSIVLRTHLEVRKFYYTEPVLPFGSVHNYDWPVPKGARRGVSLLTHTQDPTPLKPAFVQPPFTPISIPNPPGAVFPLALRTWVVGLFPYGGWGDLNPTDTPNWSAVSGSNSPGWGGLNPGISPSWSGISGVNSPGWGDVNDANTVTWSGILANNKAPNNMK